MLFNRKHRLGWLVITLILTGCSKQNWYQGMQSAKDAHCLQEPASEYEDCIRQADDSYDEYEKNREALKTDPASR